MTEKFLITGGQGFIGSWITRLLLEQGVPVVIHDRAPDNSILSQVVDLDILARADRVFGDLVEPESVRRAVKDHGVTHVIHLAGLQVPSCRRDPRRGGLVNVIGTINVFEAVRAAGEQVRCVVYASSAAVAGAVEDYGGRILDDARHAPRTHYGVFKTANEGNARVYYLDHGIRSVGLRPYTAYGVGREVGVTSGPTKAVKAAVLGRAYTIRFSGPTSFVYIEDLARVFIRCASRAGDGAFALNVRGLVDTVESFVEALRGVLGQGAARIRCTGDPLPIAHDFDESGLERLLGAGEVPRTSLRDGIAQTAGMFRELALGGRLHDRDLRAGS